MTKTDHFDFAPVSPAEIDIDPQGIIAVLIGLRSDDGSMAEDAQGGGIYNDATIDGLLSMIEPLSYFMDNGTDPNGLLSMVEPLSF
ncbi:MAG: hypothetical protein AAF317_13065 [Pseudomonadota bacterium]